MIGGCHETRSGDGPLALMLLATATKPQQPESQPLKERTSRTKVVLLGTGTPVPDPDRFGPATAIVRILWDSMSDERLEGFAQPPDALANFLLVHPRVAEH